MANARSGLALELCDAAPGTRRSISRDRVTPLLFSVCVGDFLHGLKRKGIYFKVFNHGRSLANLSCPVLGGSLLLLQPPSVVTLSHQPQT